MASTKISFPAYRLHRGSGQAFVQIKGKRHYLGVHNTQESKEAYSRFIAEMASNPIPASPVTRPDQGFRVVELCSAYWDFAQEYYQKNGKPTSMVAIVRTSLSSLKALYGSTEAKDFGPLALQAIQQHLAQTCARRSVNHFIDTIRRAFKWAVSKEMIPAAAYHAIMTVPGLREGRSAARETAPILPVAEAVVDATLPNLSPVVADMVRFQKLTGARPGEVCRLRPMDLDRSGEIWEYRPASHKTQHRGKSRVIFIGPQAQVVLLPYLLRSADAYCFSPVESEAKRYEEMRLNRKTPVQPSQQHRRKPRRSRSLQAVYAVNSYAHSIKRGIMGANKKILKDADEMGIDNPVLIPAWHPNQLRHSAATMIRREYGLEAAQVILGHSKADTTQIYAERDSAKAIEVVKQIG